MIKMTNQTLLSFWQHNNQWQIKRCYEQFWRTNQKISHLHGYMFICNDQNHEQVCPYICIYIIFLDRKFTKLCFFCSYLSYTFAINSQLFFSRVFYHSANIIHSENLTCTFCHESSKKMPTLKKKTKKKPPISSYTQFDCWTCFSFDIYAYVGKCNLSIFLQLCSFYVTPSCMVAFYITTQ